MDATMGYAIQRAARSLNSAGILALITVIIQIVVGVVLGFAMFDDSLLLAGLAFGLALLGVLGLILAVLLLGPAKTFRESATLGEAVDPTIPKLARGFLRWLILWAVLTAAIVPLTAAANLIHAQAELNDLKAGMSKSMEDVRESLSEADAEMLEEAYESLPPFDAEPILGSMSTFFTVINMLMLILPGAILLTVCLILLVVAHGSVSRLRVVMAASQPAAHSP